jgi:hypothetical protein
LIVPPTAATIAEPPRTNQIWLQIPHLADITPDVSLLAKVGQSGHSVAEAVAELVDNAIDARVGKKAVRVEVEFDAKQGWISVSDNGHGMSRSSLADALVLGLSSKSDGDIGRFGLGLKTACTSLGPHFEIRTTEPGAKVEWLADYDEKQFIEAGEWVLPIRRQAKTRDHGTSILVHSARIYPNLGQSLARNLGSTFRHFIDDGILKLTLNGEPVSSYHQDVDNGSTLPLDGEVGGLRVRGWVGLLQVSSQRGWYGFSLIRNRRVIRRHEKLGFRAHPSTARVVGELHLDRFPVNNLKTDFIRETEEWRELEGWVSAQIEPVLAASRALAHAGTFDPKIRSAIEEERERIMAALGPEEMVSLPYDRAERDDASRPVNLVLGTTHMAHRFEAAGTTSAHFRAEYVARPDDADLISVITNVEHPAMTGTDPSQIACHCLAEAASLALGEKSDFISLKARLVAVLLEQKPVRRAIRDSFRDWSSRR